MRFPCTVMIVEDDRDITHVFNIYLARLGIDSIAFSDPKIALGHLQQCHGRYCVVLLDWNLPDISGLDLIKRIRKYDSKVKIILLTAYQIDELVKNEILVESKVSEIYMKPICLEFLGSRLLELCSETTPNKS